MDLGHSIVVVEYNMQVIARGDYVIDLGLDGGKKVGSIIFEWTVQELLSSKISYTARYLKEYLKNFLNESLIIIVMLILHD